jgi:hypothetical protein
MLRSHAARGERLVGIDEVVDGHPELLEVVHALIPPGRFPRLLHRRQQQRHEDGNNGDDNEQLDQRETGTDDARSAARLRTANLFHDNLSVWNSADRPPAGDHEDSMPLSKRRGNHQQSITP